MGQTFEEISHLGTTVRAFVGRPPSHDALLRRAARRFRTRTAVRSPAGTLTYEELDRAATSAALSLRAHAEEGDVVAVAMGHDLPLFLAPFVASRAGVTVLLLNAALTPAAWAGQLRTVNPVVVVADADRAGVAGEAARTAGVPVRSVAEAWDVQQSTAGTDLQEGDPDQTLALIATSGTTGVPKMTRVTTRGLIHAGMAYCELLGLQHDEVSYVCLPLSYIGPLSAQSTTMPLVGGVNVIPDDTGPTGAAARMAQAGVTYVDAVPAWLGLLAREAHVAVPTWRTLIYGGAPMPPETASLLARRHPDLQLWDVWGLSETHGPATAQRYDARTPSLPGMVGKPIPGVDVRADDGAEGDGRGPGELLVRGANVTPGYFDPDPETAGVLQDGWLHTGDVGTIGTDGTVRLLDRAKDVIMRGGANVFSVQVEQVLASHADVVEAAVFGVTDRLGEEAVMAAVVLRHGADLDVMALRTLVDQQLGRHAVPRRIAATDALPRNSNGKVDKRALREGVRQRTPSTGTTYPIDRRPRRGR